jgi:hypothetical protein
MRWKVHKLLASEDRFKDLLVRLWKSKETPVTITGNPAKVRVRYLQNTNQSCLFSVYVHTATLQHLSFVEWEFRLSWCIISLKIWVNFLRKTKQNSLIKESDLTSQENNIIRCRHPKGRDQTKVMFKGDKKSYQNVFTLLGKLTLCQ